MSYVWMLSKTNRSSYAILLEIDGRYDIYDVYPLWRICTCLYLMANIWAVDVPELGRAYEKFDSVEDFIVLPNVGHCPQDEAPHLVNPLVESFVACHVTSKASLSAEVM
ncbi:DNA ligase [Actinidia chinensis var. chinensis]|uniref:DNA ligase n=1 Tax=Actinidia chinensis var. chinensis TaxID=1590841 RepID=A0A2R6PQK6_ACTCC|nr:DNA ligase [Actinidia chinensis var. chinensis]